MALLEPAASAGFPIQYILLIAGVAALFFVLQRRRRRQDPADPRPLGSFDGDLRQPRQELEQLLTEIQDLSRDHIARLDTKIRLLNQLLLEVDQRKRELETLLGRAASLGQAPPPAPRPSKPANPLHDQVYTLVDAGREVADICRETGLEKGEVELILGLRKPDSRI